MVVARRLLAAESGIYHVYLRGTEKRDIFSENTDKARFVESLNRYAESCLVVILGRCLMSNHFHLILYTENIENLGKMLQQHLTSYVRYFNHKYNRTGHLFERRYHSKAVETEAYLRQLVGYLKANTKQPDHDWLWLSKTVLD